MSRRAIAPITVSCGCGASLTIPATHLIADLIVKDFYKAHAACREPVVGTMSDESRIALRPDPQGRLDDVVVRGVTMFRMERLDERTFWLCCYLGDGQRIAWAAHHSGRKPLTIETIEFPEGDVSYERGSKLREPVHGD